jgi:hypothetical protein
VGPGLLGGYTVYVWYGGRASCGGTVVKDLKLKYYGFYYLKMYLSEHIVMIVIMNGEKKSRRNGERISGTIDIEE